MRLDDVTFKDLLQSTAAKTPTPGGGAVASITAALAAALGQMVVNYSVGKKTLAAHDALHHSALEKLQTFARLAIELAQADALAYARLNELWRLPEDDPRRQREMPSAVQQAIDAPSQALDVGVEMLHLLNDLVGKTNAHLKSDLAIAALLADAAGRAAAWNVRINLPLMKDQQARARMADSLGNRLAESKRLCETIEVACSV